MATDSRSSSEPKRQRRVSKISENVGASSGLVIFAVIVTVPLLVLSAVLLALIFYFRVDTRAVSPSFNTPSNKIHGNNAYLVNFDSTKLTAVADWCSTVAGALPASFMGLWSYRYIASLKQMSERAGISHIHNGAILSYFQITQCSETTRTQPFELPLQVSPNKFRTQPNNSFPPFWLPGYPKHHSTL